MTCCPGELLRVLQVFQNEVWVPAYAKNQKAERETSAVIPFPNVVLHP